jgi:hypothetical protein
MGERQHVALTKCFYCLKDDRILLATKYRETKDGMQPIKDLGPANGKVIDLEPCQECAKWMKQGIILIGIDSAKSDPGWEREQMPNPWRAGGWSVIKDEAFKRIFTGEEVTEFALKHRFMFIEQEVMEKLGIIPAKGEEEDEGEVQPDGGVQEEVPEP